MNAMGISYCHSSNTIIVYRGYLKKNTMQGWMLQNIKAHNFRKWKTMPYPALISAHISSIYNISIYIFIFQCLNGQGPVDSDGLLSLKAQLNYTNWFTQGPDGARQ
jgi:hypothetical protein